MGIFLLGFWANAVVESGVAQSVAAPIVLRNSRRETGWVILGILLAEAAGNVNAEGKASVERGQPCPPRP